MILCIYTYVGNVAWWSKTSYHAALYIAITSIVEYSDLIIISTKIVQNIVNLLVNSESCNRAPCTLVHSHTNIISYTMYCNNAMWSHDSLLWLYMCSWWTIPIYRCSCTVMYGLMTDSKASENVSLYKLIKCQCDNWCSPLSSISLHDINNTESRI